MASGGIRLYRLSEIEAAFPTIRNLFKARVEREGYKVWRRYMNAAPGSYTGDYVAVSSEEYLKEHFKIQFWPHLTLEALILRHRPWMSIWKEPFLKEPLFRLSTGDNVYDDFTVDLTEYLDSSKISFVFQERTWT